MIMRNRARIIHNMFIFVPAFALLCSVHPNINLTRMRALEVFILFMQPLIYIESEFSLLEMSNSSKWWVCAMHSYTTGVSQL